MNDSIINSEAIPMALAKFDKTREQISELANNCNTIVINSQDSLQEAKELAKAGKKIENFIEDKRKELTKPLDDEKKRIMAFVSGLISDLNAAVKNLREQITTYEVEQDRLRKAEQARIEKERREAEEELRKKVADGQLIAAEELDKIDALKEQQQVAITDQPKSNLRRIWDFDIVDESLLPRQYLKIDTDAIRKAISAGVREIPGLNISLKPQLNLR